MHHRARSRAPRILVFDAVWRDVAKSQALGAAPCLQHGLRRFQQEGTAMKIKTIVFIAALALPAVAAADEPKTGTTTTEKTKPIDKPKVEKLADTDVQVIVHQHRLDLKVVDLGKLGQKRGGAAVKSFGEALIRDHQAADKDTVAFAKKHGIVKIPAEVAKTDDEKAELKTAKESLAKLKLLKGAEFDREFANMVAMEHEKEIVKMSAAIPMVANADLAAMLRNKQPMLQRHADQAKELVKGTTPVSSVTPGTQPKTKK